MGDFSHPLIPVLIHHVVDDTAGCFRKVGIKILGFAGELESGDKDDFLFVGREEEAFDTFFKRCHLFAVASVGVHDPKLAFAVGIGIGECYLLALIDPHEIAL